MTRKHNSTQESEPRKCERKELENTEELKLTGSSCND